MRKAGKGQQEFLIIKMNDILITSVNPSVSSDAKVTAESVALQFATLSIGASPDHKAAMVFMSKSTEPFRVCDLPELSAKQQNELMCLIRSSR